MACNGSTVRHTFAHVDACIRLTSHMRLYAGDEEWLVSDIPLDAHAVRPCIPGGGVGAGRVFVGHGDAAAEDGRDRSEGREVGGGGEGRNGGACAEIAEIVDERFAPVMELVGRYLKVKKVEGSRPSESLCVRGLVFSNQVAPTQYII